MQRKLSRKFHSVELSAETKTGAIAETETGASNIHSQQHISTEASLHYEELKLIFNKIPHVDFNVNLLGSSKMFP